MFSSVRGWGFAGLGSGGACVCMCVDLKALYIMLSERLILCVCCSCIWSYVYCSMNGDVILTKLAHAGGAKNIIIFLYSVYFACVNYKCSC